MPVPVMLLMVAADPREFSGLVKRIRSLERVDLGLRWSRQGRLGSRVVVLAANGAGRNNAAEAVQQACARISIRGIVSTGWCGSVDPALQAGQVIVADRVFSLDPPASFRAQCPCSTGGARSGAVLTVDRFVGTADEKQRYWSSGAVAVEMEAAAVAAEAQKRNLPFFCIRAVSDLAGASFRLDLNRARLPDGRFSAARVLWQAGLVPSRWKELLGLWRVSKRATESLGEFFGSCQFEV